MRISFPRSLPSSKRTRVTWFRRYCVPRLTVNYFTEPVRTTTSASTVSALWVLSCQIDNCDKVTLTLSLSLSLSLAPTFGSLIGPKWQHCSPGTHTTNGAPHDFISPDAHPKNLHVINCLVSETSMYGQNQCRSPLPVLGKSALLIGSHACARRTPQVSVSHALGSIHEHVRQSRSTRVDTGRLFLSLSASSIVFLPFSRQSI